MLTFSQWILRLTKGYFKATGKQPDGLAKLKIRLEAAEKVREQEKVIQFPKDRITDWWKPRPGDTTPIKKETTLEDLLKGKSHIDERGRKWTFKKRTEGEVVPIKKGISDEVATAQVQKLKEELPFMSRKELHQLRADVVNRKAYGSFDDVQRKELLDALTNQFTNKPEFASGGIAGQLHLNEGGRAGFKEGSGMKRRTFLKILGGLGALPIVGKYFKFAKPLAKAKSLTSVPITQTANMPDWLIPAINKVIKEGDNTTRLPPNKGGAYLDRQIVHSAKLGEGQKVRVYQNLDDQSIRVEYQSANNMDGVAGDGAVHLEYKAGKNVGQGKGVKTEPEFSADEAWPSLDPDDSRYATFEGEHKVSNVKDLMSDTSALKQFGTGKALTKKELKIAKQKRNEVNKINNDPNEAAQLVMDDRMPDDFASGGIARVGMFVGGLIKLKQLKKMFPRIHVDSLLEASRIKDPQKLQKMLKSFRRTEQSLDEAPSVELFDLDTTGRRPNASGGIAGELHLNRPGYAEGIGPKGEGKYNPVGKRDWYLSMPQIDPDLRQLLEELKKRKGLAEILEI